MKKMVSFLLVAMLLLSVTAIASASAVEGASGKITVTNAVDGQYYTLYRLLDADVVDGRTEGATGIRYYNESYVPDKEDPFTMDDAGNITFKDSALDGDALKPETIKWIKENLNKFTLVREAKAEKGKAEWDNLPSGYYFINTTTGTLVTITSIKPDMEVEDKNIAPVVDKWVKGGDIQEYAKENTACIDDELTYKTTITAEPGALNYVVVDTLDNGLSFIEGMEVTAEADVAITEDDYDVEIEGKNLTITIHQDYLDKITVESSKISFFYKAALNEDAVIGGDGNDNTVLLKYGVTTVEGHEDYQQRETPPAKTTTYTYKFGLYKTNSKHKIIEGAHFSLFLGDAEIPLVASDDGSGYRVMSADDKANEQAVDIVAGNVEISGLRNAEYRLVETEAPAGYNKLTDAITVTINGNDNVGETKQGEDGIYYDAEKTNPGGYEVVNQMGAELPKTGGVGTTLLYGCGAALVLGAAIILIARRKADAEGNN